MIFIIIKIGKSPNKKMGLFFLFEKETKGYAFIKNYSFLTTTQPFLANPLQGVCSFSRSLRENEPKEGRYPQAPFKGGCKQEGAETALPCGFW
ncbi:MAG: hypothetical protein Q4D33_07155 [Prevotellaceae bacterium]|nr:hypothetical protein [Prevotellaceae bacterium]